jgi:hypothetical protein
MPDRVGINPARGRATLAGIANVVIPCPDVTADSLIFLTIVIPGGTIGVPWVSAIVPGVSFSVATIALGTSVISWMVIPPT